MNYKILIFGFLLSFSLISEANKVITSSGITNGYLANKVINWDDIPYAEPPIEDLRWKAPRVIDNPSQIIISKENNFLKPELKKKKLK